MDFGRTAISAADLSGTGSLGRCGTDAIWIDHAAFAAGPVAAATVISHELAHMVQRRNTLDPSCSSGTRMLLEREAGRAAAAALAGDQYICRLADREDTPRDFGVAGHYYTIYYVMLAAGIDPAVAEIMAFYAQMPDQVEEFDAHAAGNDYFLRTALIPAPILWISDRERTVDLEIQRGLHCLNGGNSALETSYRANKLFTYGLGSLAFGITLHAFGDSFAHRTMDDESVLYRAPLGHGIEALNMRDPCVPDYIQLRPDLYRRYAVRLYGIMRMVAGNAPCISEERMLEDLRKVTRRVGDESQSGLLRALADETCSLRMADYAPEMEETRPWSKFREVHTSMLVAPNKQQVMLHAKSWESEQRPRVPDPGDEPLPPNQRLWF